MNEDYDISQVRVPDSFINQILESTSPLEKEVEETSIYEGTPAAPTPAATTPAPASNDGKIVELLTLMFEEFDKINSRFDSLQEKIDEMTTGGALGVGPQKVKRARNPETKKDPLTALLAKKLKL